MSNNPAIVAKPTENKLIEETPENYEYFFLKSVEFKQDLYFQLKYNSQCVEECFDKAKIFLNILGFYEEIEKNRTIMKENIQTIRSRFVIDNQEKLVKIDRINKELDDLKKSVNYFNKKRKFYLENIQMKEADDFSQKINIQLIKKNIQKIVKESGEIDERINHFKMENKSLNHQEFELINKILQLEKKVGEIAQNKNSIVFNISIIKEEINSLKEKVENFNTIKHRIIIFNEKKNIALNRELFHLREQADQLTKSITEKFHLNFPYEKCVSIENIIHRMLNFQNKTISNYGDLVDKLIISILSKAEKLSRKLLGINEKISSNSQKMEEKKIIIVEKYQKFKEIFFQKNEYQFGKFREFMVDFNGNLFNSQTIIDVSFKEIFDKMDFDLENKNIIEFCQIHFHEEKSEFMNLHNMYENFKRKTKEENVKENQKYDDFLKNNKLLRNKIKLSLVNKYKNKLLQQILKNWIRLIKEKKKKSDNKAIYLEDIDNAKNNKNSNNSNGIGANITNNITNIRQRIQNNKLKKENLMDDLSFLNEISEDIQIMPKKRKKSNLQDSIDEVENFTKDCNIVNKLKNEKKKQDDKDPLSISLITKLKDEDSKLKKKEKEESSIFSFKLLDMDCNIKKTKSKKAQNNQVTANNIAENNLKVKKKKDKEKEKDKEKDHEKEKDKELKRELPVQSNNTILKYPIKDQIDNLVEKIPNNHNTTSNPNNSNLNYNLTSNANGKNVDDIDSASANKKPHKKSYKNNLSSNQSNNTNSNEEFFKINFNHTPIDLGSNFSTRPNSFINNLNTNNFNRNNSNINTNVNKSHSNFDDDILNTLQNAMKDINSGNKPNNPQEKKKRFYENYLI